MLEAYLVIYDVFHIRCMRFNYTGSCLECHGHPADIEGFPFARLEMCWMRWVEHVGLQVIGPGGLQLALHLSEGLGLSGEIRRLPAQRTRPDR